MICIRVTEGDGGAEITALGHAGYAPLGQDIVCAGVSALLYALVSYLQGTSPIATAGDSCGAGDLLSLQTEEGDGVLTVEIVGSRSVYGTALDVTLAGLSLIAACYPAYVTLVTIKKGDEYEPN